MRKLSKKAEFVLNEIAIITHPDMEFVKWVADPGKSVSAQESELLEKGLVYEDSNKELLLTKAGLDHINRTPNGNVDDLIRQIKNVIPKNPSFDHIAQNLTDTALVRAIYTLLGEIGRRGDPDNPPAYAMWNKKLSDLEKVIVGADPNSLWERHNATADAFAK